MNTHPDPPETFIRLLLPASRGIPFWSERRVWGLMAVIIPLALHCTVFSLSREFYRKNSVAYDRPPHLNLGMMGELALLFLSGIVIAIYRRATIREAVVQWSVPPSLLIVYGTMVLARRDDLCLGFGFIALLISFGTLSVWLYIERGGTRITWPRNWIIDSILVGFVNAGMMLTAMSPFCCCLPGVLIVARA